jgi:hypothetical protein
LKRKRPSSSVLAEREPTRLLPTSDIETATLKSGWPESLNSLPVIAFAGRLLDLRFESPRAVVCASGCETRHKAQIMIVAAAGRAYIFIDPSS